MIRRIRLENFMSHKSTTLELADGVTVLVGPNNCGKSAVVSALSLLSTLPAREGDYMKRHGASSCRVEVELDDGGKVAWVRRASPSVEVNGESIPRISQDTENALARVHAVLRLPQVTVEGRDNFDIHFGRQKSPVFLLDETGTRAAVFFAASSDAQRLLAMQKNFRARIREKKGENARIAGELERLDQKLAHLAPLEQLGPLIAAVQREYEVLGNLGREIGERESLGRELAAAHQRMQGARARAGALAPLQSPPALEDDDALERAVADLTAAAERRRELRDRLDALAPLGEPPTLEDDESLGDLAGALSAALCQRHRLEARGRVYTELADPPALGDDASLEAVVHEYGRLERQAANLRGRTVATEPLAPPPLLEDEEAARRLIEDLSRAAGKAERLRRRCETVAPLQPSPTLDDPGPLAHLAEEMRSLEAQRSRHASMAEALAPLAEIPEAEDTSELTRLLQEWQETAARHRKCQAAWERANRELESWIAENPVCPTCGGRINPATIETGAHA